MRRLLSFLVGVGFSLLTACGGGGVDSSGASAPKAFEVDLTFAPVSGGFVISNHSHFGDLVSLSITATSERVSAKSIINITRFINNNYDFTGLGEGDWTFAIIGTLSDGRQQEVVINFVWEENREDHKSGGLRPGINRDGDARADSVDEDDDNDGIGDNEGDQCPAGDTGWRSDGQTDHDGDGCRDEGEDTDDDNDGLADIDPREQQSNLDGVSCSLLADCDNDTIRDIDEAAIHCVLIKVDCDGDGLDDIDVREQQSNSGGVGCSLLADCDGDTVGDRDEVAANCIIEVDCDNDRVGDNLDQCPAGVTGWVSDGQTDHDGDGCRDEGEDTDDDNDGLEDTDAREQQPNSDGVSCSLLADCDGDTVGDRDEVRTDCVIQADCDKDGEGDGAEMAGCVLDPDCDKDDVMDGADIDDDGDGLIELGTAAELYAVRYALSGNGSRLSADAALNTTGCGNGDTITSCNGYELVRDISLLAYARADGGKGWRPLGQDTDTATAGCQGAAFDGTFEGNGFRISDLNISRSGEDCVGLFGHIASGAMIRSLRLYAKMVMGKGIVGGLVGNGQSARIVSSSVVAKEVSGTRFFVGSLMGYGFLARIVSSSVVVGEVSGSSHSVGGLIGYGHLARILSSSVIAGVVRGATSQVGGLVGNGISARIVSSSVVAGEVKGGADFVGGLVGWGSSARVASSYAITGPISGSHSIGGIIGEGNADTEVSSSYWDGETSNLDSGTYGSSQTGAALQTPTGYDGIYVDWDDGLDLEGGSDVEDITIYCDRNNDERIGGNEKDSANRIWDFGTSSQYPAIRCTPIPPAEWWSWWFLNGTGEPQLDQMRLDELLP